MAFELYGMLAVAGNANPMPSDNIKPAYGGEEEAFLKKVVTPIYQIIAKVTRLLINSSCRLQCPSLSLYFVLSLLFLFRKLKLASVRSQNILSGETMTI